MRQELTAEVAAIRQVVWDALALDLSRRGNHVDVLLEREPEELRIRVRPGPGETYLLVYQLRVLDDDLTAVQASIDPAGVRYVLKRLLSFGAVDRAYLDAVAVGLANLQDHVQPRLREAAEK